MAWAVPCGCSQMLARLQSSKGLTATEEHTGHIWCWLLAGGSVPFLVDVSWGCLSIFIGCWPPALRANHLRSRSRWKLEWLSWPGPSEFWGHTALAPHRRAPSEDVSTGTHGSLGLPGLGGVPQSPLVPSGYISLLGNPGTFHHCVPGAPASTRMTSLHFEPSPLPPRHTT